MILAVVILVVIRGILGKVQTSLEKNITHCRREEGNPEGVAVQTAASQPRVQGLISWHSVI